MKPPIDEDLAAHVRGALQGESNDAEHDALVAVADHFGIRYAADLAEEVEDLGWPSVAEDVRDGVPHETLVSRLREFHGEADEVIALIEERMSR